MSWYFAVLKQYATFSGRARRKEYWFFVLFNIIASMILAFIDGMTGTFSAEISMGMLGGIYALAVLLPSLAVSVRRLHDTDRSGWWLLIAFVPIVGAIVLLVFAVQEGKTVGNQFGANPKEAIA